MKSQGTKRSDSDEAGDIGFMDRRLILLLIAIIAGITLSSILLLSIGETTKSRDQLRDVSRLLLKTQDLQIQYNIAREAITTFMFLGSEETWGTALQQTNILSKKALELAELDNQHAKQQDPFIQNVVSHVKQFNSVLPPLKTIRQSPRGVVSGIVSSSINQASRNYAVIADFSQIIESLTVDDDTESKELLLKTLQVQRLWLRMIAEFRAMLLIRSKISQESVTIFLDEFEKKWAEYVLDSDTYDIEVQELVESIDTNQRGWIDSFPTVVEVHMGKRWRLDLRYMEEEVNPVTNAMLTALNRYEINLNDRIKNITSESQSLENTTFIWVFIVMGLLIAFSVTMLITYKRLLISQQLKRMDAERINDMKTEFLSTVSHELRTPLNAIMGFGQLLEMDRESTLTEQQKNNIKEINLAGKHLLHLVNEILDLSAIESGNIKLHIKNIDLPALLNEALSISSTMADKFGISIDNQTTGEKECYVNADPVRLRQIFINLITNAIKYNSENGNIRISIDHKNSNVRVSVKDTGHGISQDDIEKLFQPFERLDKGHEIDGSGIGLVVTKELIQSMGGRIGVNSKPGKGSTFWVELPVA